MSRTIPIIFSLFFLSSCMPEEDLPIRKVGETPEYFIECYCQPGQSFALAATTVMPVSENLEIDFSTEMKVIIRADRDLELSHTIFVRPGSEFVYNYGSRERLPDKGIDSLYLFILTKEGKSIRARTEIPSPIEVYEAGQQGNEALIRFYTSQQPSENYYILSAESLQKDSVVHKETAYLDYSKNPPSSLTETFITLPEEFFASQIILSLKRITRANYNYQISLRAANTANQSSITTPVPLQGNIEGALGIFTCYTEYITEIPPAADTSSPTKTASKNEFMGNSLIIKNL